MTLSPRDSGKFIASHSSFVKINEDAIDNFGNLLADEIKSGKLSTSNFSQCEVHPKADDPHALNWLLVVDTLNFCFWHRENQSGWCVEGYTGYFALCAAINRIIKKNTEFLKPEVFSVVTEGELGSLFKGDNEVVIPLLKERVECLHEVGSVLVSKFDGSFENFVKKAEGSAERLLNQIVDNFRCFRDEAVYKGKKVALYKRAQILIGDIWACFRNNGVGHFNDIEKITMFADYRVPQTLIYFKVLEYDQKLLKMLRENVILENGSEEEVEIRGCSIHAVELLREYISNKYPETEVNSIIIDHFLWDFRRKHNAEIVKEQIPFHKTFSVYY